MECVAAMSVQWEHVSIEMMPPTAPDDKQPHGTQPQKTQKK
jgi:hypothetical protein